MTQLQDWFDEYNTGVFDGTLPRVPIGFNNARRTLGLFHYGGKRGIGIKISLFWDRTEEQYRNTLLHEMCHLYCYQQGWINEHHGKRWKAIARHASEVTGMEIRRTNPTHGLVPLGEANQEKLKRVIDKRNAPALIIDLGYDSYHFIVRTSKKILMNSCSHPDYQIRTRANSIKVVISDDPAFRDMVTTRSLNRGYMFQTEDYSKNIVGRINKAIEIKNLKELLRGGYDYYLDNSIPKQLSLFP